MAALNSLTSEKGVRRVWASVGSELLKLQFQPREPDATIKGRHFHVGKDHAESLQQDGQACRRVAFLKKPA